MRSRSSDCRISRVHGSEAERCMRGLSPPPPSHLLDSHRGMRPTNTHGEIMNYPEGFPNDGVVRLQGKEYITHTGLVWLATSAGPWSSSVDYVERRWAEDGLPLYVEVHVTVTAGDVSHTAIGDASRVNVGKMIATALPRMAHTRALNRALRALLGQGATTAEEIPAGPVAAPERAQEDRGRATPPRQVERATDRPTGAQVAESIVNAGEPECPHCQSRVWDNRATAKDKQPLWKCSNKQCGGGRNGYPWASWRDDHFGVQGAPPAPGPELVQEQPPPLDPADCGLEERGENFTADIEVPF